MCGITGFISLTMRADEGAQVLRKMSHTLEHRGPDGFGTWADESRGVYLGHQRLAIIDLSSAGHQPMTAPSGRFVIVFNGEIYNHLDLRKKLNKGTWVGHSDTETLLACIDAWGIVKTLEQCVGMFAIALWDKHRGVLTLIRDRIGEKPLYYGWQKGTFLFGSELKALRTHPSFESNINRESIALQFRHCYIPAPLSIYQGIYKLPAGTYLEIEYGADDKTASKPVAYWSFESIAHQGQSCLFTGNDSTATDALESKLRAAVARQMVGDVPLGAFLSGGIDSSAVVALMQEQSSAPVNTFSIGFEDAAYNEATHANLVARHLGTNHHELYVTSQAALDVIPKLSSIYDEPFSDSSQIPTFLVSAMARERVKVSLSGDGGDELFGGYNRYLWTSAIWQRLRRYPPWLKEAVGAGLQKISPRHWSALINKVEFLLPNRLRFRHPGDKLHRFAEIMRCASPQEIYIKLISHWDHANASVLRSAESESNLNTATSWPSQKHFVHQMMVLDSTTYLCDDILVKLDRAAMANGLETRTPFLDHQLVEFAWTLPLHMKIRNGTSKWLLREVLYRHVPKNLIDRPKMGFGIPLDIWLKGPLREWAENLLDPTRLKNEGFLNSAHIRDRWEEHIHNKKNWQYQIWNVLMFQSWLETNHS